MLPKRVGLASRSQTVGLHELTRVAAALNLQAARDLQPIWNITAVVSALPDPESIEPGVWPIFVVDDVGQDGALGLHYTERNQPYSLVKSGPTWSLTASHECLEMLVDPSGSWLVPSSGIHVVGGDVADLPDEKFEYLVEVADPSEGQANAYMIDDILVSDFYTPQFYDPQFSPGVRYSFSGKIVRPRQVLPGGYISWLNSRLNVMQQLQWFDAGPTIVDLDMPPFVPPHGMLPGAVPGGGLRSLVDARVPMPYQLSRLPADSAAVIRQQQRAGWLQSASALRSAAYSLARRPTAEPIVFPPPDAAQAVMERHQDELKIAGVTRLYVGWHFENNWITYQRAIVVLAERASLQSVAAALPASVEGVPIDVRRDPRKKKSAAGVPTGAMVSFESGTVREELAVPNFPGQISTTPMVAATLAAAHPAKPRVDYARPAQFASPLQPITAQMSLILHASPEQGFAQLVPFLDGVRKTLLVGMYEFTAPHIEKALLAGLSSKDHLTLTLDSPPNQGREQTVEKTRDELRQALKTRFDFAWALSGSGSESPAKEFSTSYHIKVAVKDGHLVWISSGNWNTSNQPDLDLSDEDAVKQAAKTHDRDWHVIADSPELSKVFGAFLQTDFDTAQSNAPAAAALAAAGAAAPAATGDDQPDASTQPARVPSTVFPARTIEKRELTVLPLLTPQDYRKPILDLIRSAKSRFFMQTQYMHPSPAGTPPDPGESVAHEELITAVADLIRAGTVDVRLITSEYQDHMWIERLQDAGVDAVQHLRIQPKVHNKGIVVDSKVVVVSSQNWSPDGTGPNRDGGIIIYDEEAAQYFESIFLHDWVHMADAKALM